MHFKLWLENMRRVDSVSQLSFLMYGEEVEASRPIITHFCKKWKCKAPPIGETIIVRHENETHGNLTLTNVDGKTFIVKHHDVKCSYPNPSCPCPKCRTGLSYSQMMTRDMEWRNIQRKA